MICIYTIDCLLVTFLYCAFSARKGNSTPQNDVSSKQIPSDEGAYVESLLEDKCKNCHLCLSWLDFWENSKYSKL